MGKARTKEAGSGKVRLWAFRLLAVLAIPLAALLLLEGALRLLGYGVSTDYVLKQKDENQLVRLNNNPDYFRRFFPKNLLPAPLPLSLHEDKAPGTYRVALLGGSAAMGIPEAAYGMAPILEELLTDRYPGTRFEVLNLANTAINSHVVRQIARDALQLDPDLYLVYLGNNEVVGPFGAGTVFTPLAPSRSVIRAMLALRATRTGQLLTNLMGSFGGKEAPASWQGMRMFVDQQVSPFDPRLERVYDNFEANLQDIVAAAGSRDVPVALASLAVNLKNCAPFASAQPELGPDEDRRWREGFDEGARLEAEGDHGAALQRYLAAAELAPAHADLQYRIGRCFLQTGDADNARDHLEQALELDALRFRADRRIQEILRRVALAHRGQGVVYAPARERIESFSNDDITGGETLYEHVHFNFLGNYVVARTFFNAIQPLLPAEVTASRKDGEVLTMEECAARLAYTPWSQLEVANKVTSLISTSPFTEQSDHPEQMKLFRDLVVGLRARCTPESRPAMRETFERALEYRPGRVLQRFRFASFLLEDPQQAPAAQSHAEQITRRYPWWPAGRNLLAQSLARQGLWDAAFVELRESLRLDPFQAEMHSNMGTCLLQLHPSDGEKRMEALSHFEQAHALKATPQTLRELNRARNGEAGWRVQQQQLDDAERLLRQALEDDRDYLDGHFNLATVLLRKENRDGARRHLEEVLRIDPGHEGARTRLDELPK